MGVTGSKKHRPTTLSEYSAAVMMQYNLKPKHVDRLTKVFRTYDPSGSDQGQWGMAEFSKLLQIYPDSIVSPSLEALVKLGSSSKDGRLGFEDFLVSVCSFCALTREEILQFIYIVIDSNRSGLLDQEELFAYFSASVRLKRKHNQRQAIYQSNYVVALERFREGKWQSLSFEEFCLMCDLFPHLIFPTVRFQDLLRRSVLGSRFWDEWDHERRTIFKLESESKPVNFTGINILTGQIEKVVKPGRVSMKEIFEFTKRNGLNRQALDGKTVHQEYEIESYTRERDAVLTRAPLLNLIRNPNSVYHVPLASHLLPKKISSRLYNQDAHPRLQLGRVLGALDKSADQLI